MTTVTTYTEMINAIRDQVAELGVRYLDFDNLASFAPGLSGKVFGLLQVRHLGPEKLFDAMRAAGLRIRLEVDPEQLDKMKARIADNYNPRQANQARACHAAMLPSTAILSRVLRPIGKIGGKRRWSGKSKTEKSEHMRMMAMAGVRKRRKLKKRARQSKTAHKARKQGNAS